MLSIFRRGFVAKIMLVILGIGLFAIVITGFGTGGGGIGGIGVGGGTLVSVGDEELTDQELRRDLNDRLTQAREQNPELDLAGLLRMIPLDRVIQQLVNQLAIVDFGRNSGLAASDRMFQSIIANLPEFQNMAGQFDRDTYLRALANSRRTEADLRGDVDRWLIQRQLLQPVQGSAHVPDGIARQYAALLLETRTGTVGAVPAAAMGPGQEPTQAELIAFYRRGQARYTIPERRVIRYALFGRENVAAAAKATDAEIEAAYRQNSAAYGPKESRRLSQVVLPDEAAARAFAQKVQAGTSFVQAAAQAQFSANDIAMGELNKEETARRSAPAVADAAFRAGKAALVGPVRSPLGWHVLRVEDVKTVPARPLAAVRTEIAAQVERQKAQKALQDLAGRIDEAIADGASFEEAVRREKLEIRETAPITAAGAAPGDPGWQTPPELAPLLQTAFEMEPGTEPAVQVIAPNERFAILSISNAIPAAAPPLAQIVDRVKADLRVQRANERARAVAVAIVSKINAGTPPAKAYAEAQVRLPTVQPVTAVRQEIARSREVPPPLVMLFSLPKGKARMVPAPDGRGWFVVHVTEIVPGDVSKNIATVEGIRGQFAEIIGGEYADQFAAAVRKEIDVERNDGAIKALQAELTGNRAQ